MILFSSGKGIIEIGAKFEKTQKVPTLTQLRELYRVPF